MPRNYHDEKVEYPIWEPEVPEKKEVPPVTDEEREKWDEIRKGEINVTKEVSPGVELTVPVEGWAKRIQAMMKDGRLFEIEKGVWQLRV